MYNAANNASSQLAQAIGASDTSLAVLDGSSFPEPPFVVSIEDEIIEVGAKDGSTFSALVRGTEGTTPASHASGSRVENRFTAGTYSTLKTLVEDLLSMRADNAGSHNSIYRGKFLGTSVTAEQYTAIANGTFEDMFIGDYWTIDGVNYRIAAFNYFYNVGDTALTTNHAVIVPDAQLYTAEMNPANDTTGGYANSEMRTANLANAITTIKSAFSGHVVNHRQLLTNATAGGKASGYSWYDCEVELMNEVMVYGSVACGEATYNSGYNVASSNGQLPLFALRHDLINNRQSWWLRDVVSASHFALVSPSGAAAYDGTAASGGVRPAFSIS